MKKGILFTAILLILVILLLFPAAAMAQKASKGPKDNPDPGQDPTAAITNLSFPVIATDIIQMFYQQIWDPDEGKDGKWIIPYDEYYEEYDEEGNPIGDPIRELILNPIMVTEKIDVRYTGTYPQNPDQPRFYEPYILGDDGCPLYDPDTGKALKEEPIPLYEWLVANQPWYSQPTTTSDATGDPNLIWNAAYVSPANTWQADWAVVEEEVPIYFIDWGNPLENINPIVGYRFPVEVALYTLLDEPMTAFKTGCLEYIASRDELFGVSKLGGDSFTTEIMLATVATNKFYAEVWNPDGTILPIILEPAIGPSGKMNFASAGGGWIPTMTGKHKIWLHITDPLINFTGAIVNDDDHYIMSSGCMAEELNKQKQAKTGIWCCKSTWIEVMVDPHTGGRKK